MNEVDTKWSQLVRSGFFAEYTYESRRRYAKSSAKLTAGLPSDSWIVEVGCGTGRYHRLLRELGYTNLVSVDLTIEHIRRSKELNPNGLFVVASGESLPFKSGIFDALVSNAVIEHIADPVKGLKEFARITTAAPRLVITSDCYSWRIMQLFGIYNSKMPIDRTLTYWGFKRNFTKAGFRICDGDAWGLTHYLRPLLRRFPSLQKTFNAVIADSHWSNVPSSTHLGLLLGMFGLDENMFFLSKQDASVQPQDSARPTMRLLDILASPCCQADMVEGASQISCTECSRDYEMIDGIPVLIV